MSSPPPPPPADTPDADVPPQPAPNVDTQGFWDATARGEFALCRCDACGMWLHPPLERCRRCAGATSFTPVAPAGHVHSFIVMHRASVPGQGPGPFVLALVEIDGAPGVRLSGRVADAAPSDVAVGAPVAIRIVDVRGGPFREPEFSLIAAT